jgi:hypothetical protein
MGEEQQDGGGHRLYSAWLAVVAPTVRLWFAVSRGSWGGWHRRVLVVASTLAVVSFGSGLTVAFTEAGPPGNAGQVNTPQQAAAIRAQAAAWVAQQVASNTSVACDPQMCGAVRAQGFPAGRLTSLPPTADGPLGSGASGVSGVSGVSGLVVATPAVRNQFGARLASRYAPLVLASFGVGADRVDIRMVAPDGAAAFEAQLASAHIHLVSAGTQLLRNSNIEATPAAQAALLAGRVDSRLLVTLSALAAAMPLRLVAFGDSSPGASSAAALRGAEIGADSAADLSAVLGFLHAQQAPYLPAVATLARDAGGQSLVNVQFDAPSPGGT